MNEKHKQLDRSRQQLSNSFERMDDEAREQLVRLARKLELEFPRQEARPSGEVIAFEPRRRTG